MNLPFGAQQRIVWLQLVSLQTNAARSLNSSTIVFAVAIRNNAPALMAPPHHSSACTDATTFHGGTLLLRANRFWSAGAALVPRIAPQSSVTVHITTRPTVGFKTIDELDVEARFELCADADQRASVPCAGAFSTDGAVWHKSMIEFAGDVVHAEPAAPHRRTLNILFVGAVPHSGTSTLLNTALTTLSFSKHPLAPAAVGCDPEPATALRPRVTHYTPLLDDGDDEYECCVRLLDIASGEQRHAEIVAGNYAPADDNDEHTGDNRASDSIVFVVPAGLLLAAPDERSRQFLLKQAIDKFRQLSRACGNALIAVTQIDQVPHTLSLQSAAAQQFAVSSNRVFCTPVYLGEAKRIAAVEQPCLALLLAATRQAIQNQRTRR
jgi:hypothetical protein